jgi:hypothetical protein
MELQLLPGARERVSRAKTNLPVRGSRAGMSHQLQRGFSNKKRTVISFQR